MRLYEAVFVFQDKLDDEALAKQLEAIRGEVVALGGRVSSVTRMGKNFFARPLKKKESGVYALMTFEMEPGGIRPLTERYKFNDNILRVQIVAAPAAKADNSDSSRRVAHNAPCEATKC